MDENIHDNEQISNNPLEEKQSDLSSQAINYDNQAEIVAKLKKKMRRLTINVIIAFLGVIIAMSLIVRPSTKSSATKDESKPKAARVIQNGDLKIAYINTDSVMAHYEYAKEMAKGLKAYQQQVENEGRAIVQRLQSDYDEYMKNGDKLTLTKQKEKEQDLTQRQQKLPALQQEMGLKLQERQMNDNKKLVDAIYAFINEYNKTHDKFHIILRKEYINSPVLYIDEAMDITDEIIKGLNEEYKNVKQK